MNSDGPNRGSGDVRPAKPRDADELLGQYGAGALQYQGEVVSGADGVKFLERVVAEIAAAVTQDMGKAATMAPLIALYRDQPRMDAVTDAAQHRAMEVEAVLLTLEGVPGMSTTAKDLGRRLKAQVKSRDAEARRAGLRVVDGDEDAVLAVSLGTDTVKGHVIPPGYELDLGGVWMPYTKDGRNLRKNVTRKPVVIAKRYQDVDDKRWLMGVSWPQSYGLHREWATTMIPRESMCDARKILSYTDLGCPVNSHNARSVVHWLAEYEAANEDQMPPGWSTRRMGWLGHKTKVFVLGEDIVQPAEKYDVRLDVADGDLAAARHIRCEGSEEKWIATMKRLVDHPLALLGVCAALAAPLVAVLGVPSAGVDFSGQTSTGKTVTLKVAASCFGAPSLLLPWKTSPVGIEAAATLQCDMPLILDDTKLIPPKHLPELSSLLYMICNGDGKVRSNVNITMAKRASWRTFLISSSEVPITAWSNDEGVRTRVLCTTTPPIPPGNQALVDDVVRDLGENYGWAGRRLVQWLVRNPEKRKGLRGVYQDAVATFGAKAQAMQDTGVSGDQHARLAKVVALLYVAQQIAHHELGYDWLTTAPIDAAWDAVAGTEIDKSLAALHMVYSWAVSNQRSFDGQHDAKQPPQRFLGRWAEPGAIPLGGHGTIAILRPVVEDVLTQAGFSPAAVLRDWRARGYLELGPDGQFKNVRVGGKADRCVCIRLAVVCPGGDE
jgi:putative DNA primase/helicase